MTIEPHNDAPDALDATDLALVGLLRRSDRGVPDAPARAMETSILSQAAFLLAAKRRAVRTSTADTLAAWVRIALPLAAAAALFAALTLARIETTIVVDAELTESDPAALLSALDSDGSSGLAYHLIASDSDAATTQRAEPR